MLFPTSHGLIDDLFVDHQQALAGVTHRVERTSLDEGFNGLFVQDLSVDPLREIIKVCKGTLVFSLSHDVRNKARSHISNSRQAEENAKLLGSILSSADYWSEIGCGAVHIWNHNLDPHGPAFS